ncbi:helix-turn-helix domain-containing protein [Brevibacillus parabrevis]|uniref:helix-turn-helix domain-containing protein n=1 Tax=Brevibacillus parabrevis TaxID=54914 RepID=UPI001C23D9C1|nr:helix-turn-helix domain-containing protein [Brevibacillus parabrevis]MBU8713241.1 helix-turn-helix domain-containing protein [Brevibacillus parabrevis]
MFRNERNQGKESGMAARLSLAEVREYIASRFAEPISIHELAQLTGLSPNYFGDAFKKAYGQSVMDYVTELRIGRAKQLLRDSDLYMHEVARKVGYTDEFYFSRKFKKAVGVSPSAYSKETRRRVAVTSTAGTGNLLALGIVPVAAPLDPKWSPFYHYYYQDRIPIHLSSPETELDEESLRKLSLAKPDLLILHHEYDQAIRSQLETAGIKCVEIKATKWREQLREMAAMVDRQSDCEQWLQAYEESAGQARQSVREAVGNDVFVTLRISGEDIYLYSNRGIRDMLYQDLALATIPEQKQLCNEVISLDQLSHINPDRLLVLICPDARTRKFWLSLQYHMQWRSLEAVKNSKLYVIPSNPWFEYSALAIIRMMEEATLMLTGKNPASSLVPVHGVT